VETVTGYALNGDDLEALGDEGIRSVFQGGEFEEFRQEVRTKLVPRLDDFSQSLKGCAKSSGELSDPSFDSHS
jgi:hypothetical protein